MTNANAIAKANETVYKLKSSANRAAKRNHGDNWSENFVVVAKDDGFVIEAIKPAKPVKPAKAVKPEPTTAELVDKLQAGLKSLKAGDSAPAVAAVPVAATPNAKSPAVAAVPVAKKGRPISDDQVKVRRRLQNWIDTQPGVFTVKQATKALKLKKMHVSNAMRWLESGKLVERVEYKIEKRPGRRELLFKRAGVVIEKKAA